MRLYIEFSLKIDLIPIFKKTRDVYKKEIVTGWVIKWLFIGLMYKNGK